MNNYNYTILFLYLNTINIKAFGNLLTLLWWNILSKANSTQFSMSVTHMFVKSRLIRGIKLTASSACFTKLPRTKNIYTHTHTHKHIGIYYSKGGISLYKVLLSISIQPSAKCWNYTINVKHKTTKFIVIIFKQKLIGNKYLYIY